MKKIFAILCAMMIALSLTGCGNTSNKEDETVVENCNVVGTWISEHEEGTEYVAITFNEDGSGILLNMPLEIGLALRYEVEGNTILCHMASDDDNTEIAYLPETDQISYDGVLYNRGEIVENCNVVGTWIEAHEEGADYAIMTFNEDGTGNIMNMPENIGLGFNYEINGNDIMTHMGSVEDNSTMTYLPNTDQISYGDELYSRDAK